MTTDSVNDPMSPAPSQNQPGAVWRQVERSSLERGYQRYFYSGTELWDAACKYFQWVEDNPLAVEKVFQNQGVVVRVDTPKFRVMTIQGLCLHIGVSRDCFHKWSVGTDTDLLQSACQVIRSVIFAHKFEGAAADLFNPTVISRDLGLTDKTEIAGSGGGPLMINVSGMSLQALLELRQAVMGSGRGQPADDGGLGQDQMADDAETDPQQE